MGNYTELVIKADVKKLPANIKEVFEFLFNDGLLPKSTPNHEFFKCKRWEYVGRSCSCYHIPWTDSKYEDSYLFSRSDFKNYGREIEKFIDWIMPYLNHFDGDCVGYYWYEEDQVPTLIICEEK